LSISVPHCWQVHPPHIACLDDDGFRTSGSGAPQCGQDLGGLKLIPQRFRRMVPIATSTTPTDIKTKKVPKKTMSYHHALSSSSIERIR